MASITDPRFATLKAHLEQLRAPTGTAFDSWNAEAIEAGPVTDAEVLDYMDELDRREAAREAQGVVPDTRSIGEIEANIPA